METFHLEAARVSPRETGDAAKPAQRLRRRYKQADIFTGQLDKEIASFQGFNSPWWKTLLYYLVGVLTAGVSFLVCKWSPRVHILLSLSPCALRDAQYVRIRLADGRVDLEKVQVVRTETPHQGDSEPTLAADTVDGREGLLDWQDQSTHLLLEYRCTRYFYMEGAGTFVPVPAVAKGFNAQLQRAAETLAATGQATALDEQDWDLPDKQLRYGANEMAIPVKSIPMLIFDEMWHPFYVFQYFSILIWIVGDQYYSYSVCIAVITWFSIISAAVEAHQNMKRLAEIAHFTSEVEAIRNGEVVKLSSAELVPGDIIVLQPGTLPADVVLLRGECIVDENMLTGESVPVRKVCYSPVADGQSYQPDKSPGCTLFGGTLVAQARAPRNQKAVGMVCRTRFYSAKGQLLRSILFPREHEESFISDSLRFIVVMLAGCMGLYIWAAVVLHSIGSSPDRIVVRFFDMITIAVPPALPACLTIATVFSIGRLRKKGVYVTSPDRITLAGQLDVICFDKTGTLTEQGLDLQGIVPIVGGRLHNMVCQMSLLPVSLVELLASCHGLARMGEALVGDPLDQKLFQATHWDLIDERPSLEGTYGGAYGTSGGGAPPPGVDGVDGSIVQSAAEAQAEATGTATGVHTYVRPPGAIHAYAIVKRFEFSAALQRNLVVVRAPDNSVAVFAKGSPEAIRSLVAPSSVPPEFDALLGELTREGLRVLALAAGDASLVPETQLLHWTQAETELHVELRLVGLAVMANPLRPDTADVISKLQHATIRTVMVTGDHLRTAISVAHKCHILPEQRPILLVDAADAPQPSASPPSEPNGPSTPSPASAQLSPSDQLPPSDTYSFPVPMVQPSLSLKASGPGPAGEPTPMGDPSIANNWGALSSEAANQDLLAQQRKQHGLSDSPSHTHLLPSAGASPPVNGLAGSPNDASAFVSTTARPPTVVAHSHVNGNGVADQPPPQSLLPPSPGLRLSVLNVDGAVDEGAAAGGPSALVARVLTGELECAVTGKGFSWMLGTLDAALLVPVLQRAAVFARMSPDNKRDLMLMLGSGIDGVEGCPKLGLRAGFCGDGANDCGALKAAHVGVSLCEAEASVAAPMTSKAQTIASMITVVAEGRCTLMATYQIFQFIIAYALVQAFETNLMYTYALNLGNYQYLIQDLFFTTVLAALMGFTEPRNKLSRSRPLSRVMSFPLMTSTVAQLVVIIVFQLASLRLLQMQPEYVRFRGGPELHDTVAPENTTTYIVALAQFVVLALVFNKGMPHRSPLWTNKWLVLVLVVQTAFVLYTLFSDDLFNQNVQQLVDRKGFNGVMDMAFRWKLLALIAVMGVGAFAMEYLSMGLVKMVTWAQGRRPPGSVPHTVPQAVRMDRAPEAHGLEGGK